MVRALYLRIYDALYRRPGVLLVLVGVTAAASVSVLPRLALDMSFRPLFGQDRAELEATRRLEAVFGQRSGAHIGAIVTPDRWSPDFFEALADASDDVARLERVSEVVSLTRLVEVEWGATSAEALWATEPGAVDTMTEEDFHDLVDRLDDDALERILVSSDGNRTLLLARVDLPLQDLRGRAGVIADFQRVVDERLRRVAHRRWIGLSVVEVAYSRLVLSGLATSLLVTSAVLLVLLLAVYRRVAVVASVMAGVCVALPFALAVMALRGQAVTIVNSMVPTMILIIGVADAIHMFESYAGHVRAGHPRDRAVREMFGDMALPCLLTTLTTVVGFLALETARIEAIRDFGANVAVGIVAVYAANLVALPALLLSLPERRVLPARRTAPARWIGWTSGLLVRRPGRLVAASTLGVGFCVLGLTRVDVDQRFNEDVSADEPVRVSQALYEQEFMGFLGPDVTVRRLDGRPLLSAADRSRLGDFVHRIEGLSGVIHVESLLDLVPDSVGAEVALAGLTALRRDARTGARVRELVDPTAKATVVAVHIADVGSRASLELAGAVERAAERALGPAYEVRVAGQWWLAQLGLANILRDMLVSFATSFALVLPLLGLTLGSLRLVAVGLLPNVLPALFALGFMGWTGISVRVGTAMILAIALAIAVDDTIHVLARLRRESQRSHDPRRHVQHAIEHAGVPVLLTTLVLVGGFLGMSVNGLLAIRDMGIVAAATLAVAFLADVYLLPASYLLLPGSGSVRSRSSHPAEKRPPTALQPASTSPDV